MNHGVTYEWSRLKIVGCGICAQVGSPFRWVDGRVQLCPATISSMSTMSSPKCSIFPSSFKVLKINDYNHKLVIYRSLPSAFKRKTSTRPSFRWFRPLLTWKTRTTTSVRALTTCLWSPPLKTSCPVPCVGLSLLPDRPPQRRKVGQRIMSS